MRPLALSREHCKSEEAHGGRRLGLRSAVLLVVEFIPEDRHPVHAAEAIRWFRWTGELVQPVGVALGAVGGGAVAEVLPDEARFVRGVEALAIDPRRLIIPPRAGHV